MSTSEARIAANRANAQKSSGPKTEEGKERSRANSFKHGLTGAGVVLPSEDAEQVQRRFDGFQAALKPATDAGVCLARRAAMLSVRLERCVVHEAAAISTRVRHAVADFDEARMAEVDQLMASLGDEPATSARRLQRLPEGVDRMIATWETLRADLGFGDRVRWTAEHEEMAENLNGRSPAGFGVSRVRVLSRAIRGDFDLLDSHEGPATDPASRKQWARLQMAQVIDAEIARLRAVRETLDLGAIANDRAEAASLALFDPSPQATLARKYEAAAERMMYRALRELKQVEAARGTREESSPTHSGRLGSFFPVAEADPKAEEPPVARTSAPLAPAPTTVPASQFDAPSGSSFVPISIGRVV